MQPGRSKAFIWLFVSLVLAGLLLLAIVLRPAGVDKWEVMTNRVDRLKLEARSRKLPRSPLRGKLLPGNAWDEYNIALNDARTWVDDQNGALFARYVNGDNGMDRVKVEQLVASHASALDHLQLGAQRSDGQYPYNWERGTHMEIPSLLSSRRLANAAVAQARIWSDKGRTQNAVDLVLDVSVFGRDLATNGPLLSSLIGYALYSVAFDEFRHLLVSGKLTRQQLATLGQKLEVMDRDLPGFGVAFSNENMFFGAAMLEMGMPANEWLTFLKRGELRVAMSPQSSMVEAFEMSEGYMQRSMKLDQMSYVAARAEATAISSEAETARNPLVRMSMPSIGRSHTVHREVLAQLRLLRAATAFLATGKMPIISDPFGTNLLHKQENGKSIIWSIGSDGVNQGGKGTWDGKPDMVLEVSK